MDNKILEGITVSSGTVTGKVKVITEFDQLDTVEDGDIMVIPTNHPLYAVGVMNASGLICEEGGIISHICTVALEMGIPCITQAKDAVEVMMNRELATLDADKGVVYDA